MIKTHPSSKINITLSDYRNIVEKFLPFVLVRCSRYTNSKRLAEIISNYVFICTYRLTEMLDGFNLPVIIECMTGIVGEDLSKSTSFNGQLLFEKQNALNAVRVLSKLDIYECLGLVLCYTENLDLGQIAETMNKSADGALEIISRGQRLFIENLSRLMPKSKGTIFLAGEIRRSMGSIADCLDRSQAERIITAVMGYLLEDDFSRKTGMQKKNIVKIQEIFD